MTGKLTKSQSKYVKSLQQKKYRDKNGCFVAEGIKLVSEALRSNFDVDFVAYTGTLDDYDFDFPNEAYSLSPKELSTMSSLKSPNKLLAVCSIPTFANSIEFDNPLIVLDAISDPGNLGTIIRLCDWFGFRQILCSEDSVDCFNPKVVQATMGSIFRVNVMYGNIAQILNSKPAGLQVFASDMEGENLFELEVPKNFVLLMGSESHGISDNLRNLATTVVSIPKSGGGESLNVAISTGIIVSNFRYKLSQI